MLALAAVAALTLSACGQGGAGGSVGDAFASDFEGEELNLLMNA